MFTDSAVPFVGTQTFPLYLSLTDAKAILSNSGVPYQEEIWSSESETTPNPWTVLTIGEYLSLFFAKNEKMFKIVLWKNYSGSLPNGIQTGMNIKQAQSIDASLVFDDWNEDYESSAGYWLEDDVESGEIISISIFIKELLDEDLFDACNW